MHNSLYFEHHDWSPVQELPQDCESAWADNQGMMIGLQHIGADKALRDRLPDVNAVRDHYRAGFAAQGMGLIECELVDIDEVHAVRAIGKIILQPVRAAYAGTIALPLPMESYVFNVAAQEDGITGVRDTAVWLKTSTELEKQGYALELPPEDEVDQQAGTGKAPMVWKHVQTGSLLRWAQDPYDPDYDGPCLRNMADAEEHDAGFPQHPLSRVRFALQCLVQGVKLSADTKQKANHKRRWRLW